MKQKAIHVYRGDYVESKHAVHIAVVDWTGKLIAYYGDPHRLTFARSSMKPFQAVPVVRTGSMEGFSLTERELSLFCASHIGEPYHRETVFEVLEKIGLEEKDLQCGTHIPRHRESYEQLIQAGGELTPVFSNCSGKHSGMLAGVVKQKMDVATYREIEHPYQQQILDIISSVGDYERENIAMYVDGCGVPVLRLPLLIFDLLYSRVGRTEDWTGGSEGLQGALSRGREAIKTYSEMVAGTKQFYKNLMTGFS